MGISPATTHSLFWPGKGSGYLHFQAASKCTYYTVVRIAYRVVGSVRRMIVLGLGTASVGPVIGCSVVDLGPVRRGHRPPGRSEQRHVQSDGQRVPGVVHGRDRRYCIHGPVETEPPWIDEQPDVLDGQIQERQRPGDQAGRFGRRVVGRGENGRTAVAHQRHSHEQQTGRRARQYHQRPVHSTGVLEKSNEKNSNKKKKKNNPRTVNNNIYVNNSRPHSNILLRWLYLHCVWCMYMQPRS